MTLISSDNDIRLDDDVVLQLVSSVRASNLFAYIEYDMTEHNTRPILLSRLTIEFSLYT